MHDRSESCICGQPQDLSPESSQCRHQISPTLYNCWLIAVGSWYEPAEDFLFLWSGRLVRSASEVHCTAGVCTAHRSRAGRGKKRNSEHKFHVPMSSSGGKNKVSVVLVSEQSFGILSKSTTNYS